MAELKGTVLVVDDDEDIRSLARRCLERAGFSVLSACNGWEGLDTYQQFSTEIRAIVLDINMPILGGMELLRILRGMNDDIPVVLSGGGQGPIIVAPTSGESSTRFLGKPYRPVDLVSLLNNILSP